MNRINIYENDLTTAVVQREGTDVVYIPGFAVGGNAAYGVPVLCKTIEEFKQAFGTEPAKFVSDQYYADLATAGIDAGLAAYIIPNGTYTTNISAKTSSSGESGKYYYEATDTPTVYNIYIYENSEYKFLYRRKIIGEVGSSDAKIDISPAWFKQGDYDIAYIYASELLIAGLPVLYERVNTSEADITIETIYKYMRDVSFNTQSYPEWSNVSAYAVGDYVTYSGAVYRNIEAISAPNPSETNTWDANKWLVVTLNEAHLLDKGEFNVKYITSGGYPSFEIADFATRMAYMAYKRGDAVALIDHVDNAARPISTVSTESIYYSATKENIIPDTFSSYATLIMPWCNMKLQGVYKGPTQTVHTAMKNCIMPGSFAYLMSLAKSIKTYANFLAIAGVARGLIPNFISLHTNYVLSNAIAEAYQSETGISINPITNIKPYGYCIWGNRTLKDNTEAGGTIATSFLNIRNMLSDIKKQAYMAAKSLMFEQNTDILWVNFTTLLTPLLDAIKNGQGISGYKLIKHTVSPVDGSQLPRTKLSCTVRIYPIYAVESFDIYVELTDDEVSVD